MPNQLILDVTPGTLPVGACPSPGDWQGILNLISGNQTVVFPASFSGVIQSTTAPSDQTQTWIKLDATGRPIGEYVYAAGAWISRHPILPGMIQIWPFIVPDFTSFDGGDANSPSAVSGPMWQLPQDGSGNPILVAQFPLGVGSLPSGLVVAAGTVGGEENHTLLIPEMPSHSHGLTTPPTAGGTGLTVSSNNGNNPGTGALISNLSDGGGDTAPIIVETTGGNGATPPVTTPHNTMPPYYGVTYLQRTNRLFYVG